MNNTSQRKFHWLKSGLHVSSDTKPIGHYIQAYVIVGGTGATGLTGSTGFTGLHFCSHRNLGPPQPPQKLQQVLVAHGQVR